MSTKKYIILALSIALLLVGTIAQVLWFSDLFTPKQINENLGASVLRSYQVGTNPINGYYLKTDGSASSWEVGGGGGATDQLGQIGDVSTTTLASGYILAYDNNNKWTSTSTIFVKEDGKVGIGTTSPYAKLSVWSSGNLLELVNTASTTVFAVDSSGNITNATWNGTAIADAYIADDITASNYLSLTAFYATTTHQLINSLPSLATVGVITTGTWQALIYNGANPTIDATGKLAINTTAASSSLRYHDGVAERALYPEYDRGFNFASSTLSYMGAYGTTGTTTLLLINQYRPITLTHIYCKTDTGTAIIQFSDGTNDTDYLVCETAGTSDDSLIVNNAWIMREDFKIKIGSQTGNPSNITVTATIIESAD